MNAILNFKNKILDIVSSIISDKKKKAIATAIITALILIIGLVPILYYIIGPSAGFLTADTVDSLEWAEAYRQTGDMVSDSYYYAAVLPFGGNQIFLPFLAIFGYSVEAQIGGMVLYTILLAAALYYFARGLDLNYFWSAGLVSVTMLLLSTSAKLREIMWEHIFYYNLGILFFCVGFGIVFRLIRDGVICDYNKKTRIGQLIRLGILLVFCMLASLDGLQTLVCLTLPLVAGIIGERFLDKDTPLLSKKNYWGVLVAVGVGIFSLVGMLLAKVVTKGIVADYAEGYSNYGNMSDWGNNLLKIIVNWMSLFGVSYGSNDPLLSISSILNMIRIFISFILLILPVVMLCQYKKIESKPLRIALLGHFAVTAFIVFACTFGKLITADWRLTPMLGTAIITTFLGVIELIRQKGLKQRFGALVLVALIVGAGISAGKMLSFPSDYGKDNSWHVLAEELKERDLEYGYATFWWANSTKAISGGEVEIAPININEKGIHIRKYQAYKDSWDDKETDRYFVVMTEQEYETLSKGWIGEQYAKGVVKDFFEVKSAPYDLSRHGIKGSSVYVLVLNENPF